jgi:hypothetical protein
LSFEFNYRVLSRRKGIKMIYGSETLIDQEQHLALEMSTSKMAHAGIEREREREYTCKTTSRQSLSN